MSPHDRRFEGEHPADWAVRTDRIMVSDYADWRGRVDADRRVIAQAGPAGETQVGEAERVLASLMPVPRINDRWRTPAAGRGVAAPSASDDPHARLFPPTSREEQERRWAEDDELADRRHADHLARVEAQAAQQGLTDEEYRILFRFDPDPGEG
jgi:hypothetical protein